MVALDIAWGLLTGLAAWVPSWVLGRSRRWHGAVDLLALFIALVLYWEVIDPNPARFTDRVFAFTLAAVASAGCGYVLRQRNLNRAASTR